MFLFIMKMVMELLINSFTKVNPLKKYFSGYYKIEDGKILEEKASKKDIRNFRKVILWFPLTAKIKG